MTDAAPPGSPAVSTQPVSVTVGGPAGTSNGKTPQNLTDTVTELMRQLAEEKLGRALDKIQGDEDRARIFVQCAQHDDHMQCILRAYEDLHACMVASIVDRNGIAQAMDGLSRNHDARDLQQQQEIARLSAELRGRSLEHPVETERCARCLLLAQANADLRVNFAMIASDLQHRLDQLLLYIREYSEFDE